MDAVTYPDETVKEELTGHWLTTKVDVSERKEVATQFGVSAIPMAVALTGEGEVLGRVLGFVEPARFGDQFVYVDATVTGVFPIGHTNGLEWVFGL